MTVSRLTDLASAVTVALAVVAGASILLAVRRRDVALAVLLDLLTAAGLLHLAASPTYMRAASAAVVVAVRRLVTWSLAAGGGRAGAAVNGRIPPGRPPGRGRTRRS